MAFTQLTGTAPFSASKPCPISEGRQGMVGGLRNREAMVTGSAVARSATNTTAALLDIYKHGNASARAEFFGVLSTDGAAQDMAVPAATDDSNTVNVITDGYAKALLAPGQTVRKDQWIEPIPDGTGYFRLASGNNGVAFAESDVDNSGGSDPVYIGAHFRKRDQASVLLGKIAGPSATVTNTASETAYSLTVTVPKYTARSSNKARIVGGVRCLNTGASATVIKVKLGSLVLCTSASLTPNANDIYVFSLDLDFRSSTAVLVSGCQSTFAAAGTAAALAVMPAVGTYDATVANDVSVTVTYGGTSTSDQTRLETLSVEWSN